MYKDFWSDQVRLQISFVITPQALTFLNFRYSNRVLLINDIYFYFYLFFLIFRTLAVLYSCSSVHNASSYPLIAIRRTPTANWSENVSFNLEQSECLSKWKSLENNRLPFNCYRCSLNDCLTWYKLKISLFPETGFIISHGKWSSL